MHFTYQVENGSFFNVANLLLFLYLPQKILHSPEVTRHLVSGALTSQSLAN